MTDIVELQTERLILRQWRDEDLPVFANINADPEVMEFYPKPLSKDESNAMVKKAAAAID